MELILATLRALTEGTKPVVPLAGTENGWVDVPTITIWLPERTMSEGVSPLGCAAEIEVVRQQAGAVERRIQCAAGGEPRHGVIAHRD